MGVEIGLQRLIFCGRVLQDEKKLADYGKYKKKINKQNTILNNYIYKKLNFYLCT